MATAKKGSLTEYDLDFLEVKLAEYKTYIDANPFSRLTDRYGIRMDKQGNSVQYVIATKETQRKDLSDSIKNFAELLQIVKGLRELKEKELQARGGKEVSRLAKKLL